MSQLIRSPINISFREQQIQPWTADQTHMVQLILESSQQLHTRHTPNTTYYNNSQYDAGQLLKLTNSSPKSYNFQNNLRKYASKKAGYISYKKDGNVNFIEKNKKELCEEFEPYNIYRGEANMSKVLHQRYKQKKCMENELLGQEPVNCSMIMYYETDKSQRRTRHKDIQSFLRFQSQKIQKITQKKNRIQQKISKEIEQNLSQADNYQRILKLREGLRRRNLKSASQSRKLSDNTLNIEQECEPTKIKHLEGYKKQIKRSIPKTSDSNRSRLPVRQLDFFGEEALVLRSSNKEQKQIKMERRIINTSQKSRPIVNAFRLDGMTSKQQ